MKQLLNDAYLRRIIPVRKRDTHKGDYGKLLIIGGSVGYTGAPVMAANAALRTGAGLVFLAAPECIYPIQAARCMEAVCIPAPGDGTGYAAEAAEILLRRAESCDACVLGPGLGRSEGAAAVVEEIVTRLEKPLVVDADGINLLSERISILRERKAPCIVTPHAVEFERLGGDLALGREAAALDLAGRLGCIVVLKGPGTLVASPDGALLENTTGNPGMAVGGSGDVLAGVIGALLGQHLAPMDAAGCGVYLHGLAGDLAAAELGEYGMLPSDIIAKLPQTLKDFSSRKYLL